MDAGRLAADLAVAMTRLRSRKRRESAGAAGDRSWTQLATLARVVADGPTTTSALAAAEHVRAQSMAAVVAALKADGLVATTPDPDDGRQTLIVATDAGRAVYASVTASSRDWLARAVADLEPAERRTLAQAVPLLHRLADAGTPARR